MDIIFFLLYTRTQASVGWTYYFKKQHNIVDRHIDKICVATPAADAEKVKISMEHFKEQQFPVIKAYDLNKVFHYIYKLFW